MSKLPTPSSYIQTQKKPKLKQPRTPTLLSASNYYDRREGARSYDVEGPDAPSHNPRGVAGCIISRSLSLAARYVSDRHHTAPQSLAC
jgi:hypothetical protein